MGNNFASTPTFSIDAWVKIDSGDTSSMTPVAKHWATVNQGYYLSVNNVFDGCTQANLAGFRSLGAGGCATAVGEPVVNDGLWHQLVGVYNNGTANLYVDGNLAASTQNNGYSNNSADFIVGGLFNANGQPTTLFHGLIDEVEVYNNALSGNDVRALYDSYTQTTVPEPSTIFLFSIGIAGLVGTRIRKKPGRVRTIRASLRLSN